MRIRLLDTAPGETLRFAQEELEGFLARTSLSADFSATMQTVKGFGEEEFSIDGQGGYQLCGGSETALLYAAYRLLNELGFYFLSPDPWDTVIPERIDEFPVLNIRTAPRFPWRGFFGVEKRDTPEFLLWMARNGLNFWSLETHHPALCRKLGMKQCGNPPSGMHRLFEDYLNPGTYFAAHPEYYAWDGEKRNSSLVHKDTWNICISNPEAADQLAENLIRDLQPGGRLGNAAFLTFAPFDNGKWCRCENCERQGNRTTRFLLFADRCSRAIRKAVKRPVYLIVPAYHETLMPPDRPLPADFDYERILVEFFPIERCYAHEMDDASCKANALLTGFLAAWSKLEKFRFFICEYYNVSTFSSAAISLDREMEHDLRFYAGTGAFGISYMHVSTALWGELALNNCAFAAAAWGKTFSREEFFAVRYRNAAGAMREVYEKLDVFTAIAKIVFHYQSTGELNAARDNTVKYGIGHYTIANGTPLQDLDGHCTPEKLADALQNMREAYDILSGLVSASAGVLRERLACDRMRLEYTLTRFEFITAFLRIRSAEERQDAAQARQAAEELLRYGEKLRSLKEAVQHIRAEGAPNLDLYYNGFTSAGLQQPYADVLRRYGLEPAPFAPDEGVKVIQG